MGTPTPTPTPILPTPQPPQAGWVSTAYTYASAHPHAVTAAGSNSYAYDANRNMTCRVENGMAYSQVYDAENRLATVRKLLQGTCVSIIKVDSRWDFTYAGDGASLALKPGATYFTLVPLLASGSGKASR